MLRRVILCVVLMVPTTTFCPQLKYFPGSVTQEEYERVAGMLDMMSKVTRTSYVDGFFVLLQGLRDDKTRALADFLVDTIVVLLKSGPIEDLAMTRHTLFYLGQEELIFRALFAFSKDQATTLLRTNKELRIWWDIVTEDLWMYRKPKELRWGNKPQDGAEIINFVRTITERRNAPDFLPRGEEFDAPPGPSGGGTPAAAVNQFTQSADQPSTKPAPNIEKPVDEKKAAGVDGVADDAFDGDNTSAPMPASVAAPHNTIVQHFFNKPVSWLGVGAAVPFLATLYTFYRLKNVEQLLQHGNGWLHWRPAMPLDDLKKLSAQELTRLLAPDIFARRGSNKFFSSDEKMLADFLLEVEQEIASLKSYKARFNRIKAWGLGMLFGLDARMLEKAERGVARLEIIHQKVVEHTVETKLATNMGGWRASGAKVCV